MLIISSSFDEAKRSRSASSARCMVAMREQAKKGPRFTAAHLGTRHCGGTWKLRVHSGRASPGSRSLFKNQYSNAKVSPGKLFSLRDSATGLSYNATSPPTVMLPNDSGSDSSRL